MKNKQSGFGLVGILTVIVVVGLIAGLGFVGYKNFIAKDGSSNTDEYGYDPNGKKFPPLVAGANYTPEDMPAQERADYMAKFATVPGLDEALSVIAQKNPCAVTEGRFKQRVLGVTADQTQALVGNGCGSTGLVRSFMIKEGDSWKRVGSANGYFNDEKADNKNFNELLDTPNCEVVDKFKIQKSIAPVCFNTGEGQSELYAGDSGNYTYVLR